MLGIPARDRSRVARYVVAVLLSISSTLARAAMNPVLGQDVPFIFHFPAVVVSAWLGGIGPGIVTTVLSALQAWYFFLAPGRSLIEIDVSVPLAIFLGVGVLISLIAEHGHASRREADAERERLRVTLASIGDAVIATDASGRLTFLNPVAEALTGWPVEEATGRRKSGEDGLPPWRSPPTPGRRTGSGPSPSAFRSTPPNRSSPWSWRWWCRA